MLSRFLNRWGWLLAVLGGVFHAGLNGIIEIVFPEHWAGSSATLLGLGYADTSRLLWLPEALLLGGLTAVAKRHAQPLGRIGKYGFLIAAVGLALNILGSLVEFWVCGVLLTPWLGPFRTGGGCSNIGYTVSGYGTVASMIGLLLFGVAGLRSDLPLGWRVALLSSGLLYASLLIIFVANLRLFAAHAIAFGLMWIFIGFLLKEDRAGPKPGEPRARRRSARCS